MAELAREVRYVKQRFKRDDADRRPYLVRSLKIELRDRDKPERQDPVDDVFAKLATELPTLHAQTLLGLSNALTRLWGRDAMIRSEEHTSELQSLMRISYAVFCLKKKNNNKI